jgi:hypothetical protein
LTAARFGQSGPGISVGETMAISFMTRLRAMTAAMEASRNARVVELERQRSDPDFFSQRGGVRLDLFNATWPMATLSADKDSLRLWCPPGLLSLNRLFVFPRDKIRRLSKYRGLWSSGLRIEHMEGSFPQFIVFWSFNFTKLKSELMRLDYDVEDRRIWGRIFRRIDPRE